MASIGNVPLRLRDSSVEDISIKEMFDNKHRYGCRTNSQLIKKALLHYKNMIDNNEHLDERTEKCSMESLFR